MIVKKISEVPSIEIKELYYKGERKEVIKSKMRWIIHGKVGDQRYRKQVALRYVEIGPGGVVPTHDHLHQEIFAMLTGKLKLTAGCESFVLEPGDITLTYPWEPHSLINEGDETATFYCITDCPDPAECIPPKE